MKVRFQADADLDHRIVRGIRRREPQVDFLTAHTAGLRELSDPEVLKAAAESGRVLVTHDKRTMPGLFAEFIRNRTTPGVFVIGKHVFIRDAVEEILLIWAVSDAEEWRNR